MAEAFLQDRGRQRGSAIGPQHVCDGG